MKNESAFNQFLARELNAIPDRTIYATKLSDRFKSGISDFIIWVDGSCVCIECKHIESLEKTGNLLHHPFSQVQLRFLQRVSRTRNFVYGLVSVDDVKAMYLLPSGKIQSDGNVTASLLLSDASCFRRTKQGIADLIGALRKEIADARL